MEHEAVIEKKNQYLQMREMEEWAGNHRIPSLLLPGAAAPREGFHQSRDYRGNSVRLYFLGSKITADGDCSHEIKRHSLGGKLRPT